LYRYSSRLRWDLPQNSISRAIAAKKTRGERLIDLTVSNPTEVLNNYPHEEIRRALCQVADFAYQPDALGHLAAREAVGAYYRARGISVDAGQIVLTASTSEAYSLLFKLFCDPGDEILIPVPSYPLFEFLAGAESVRAVPYRLVYDGVWCIDFDDLESRISEQTRAVVIVSPNNPTGSFLKLRERERLLELMGDRKIPCISDEVFADYCLDRTENAGTSLIGSTGNLSFSFGGLSKSAGMPQMKAAWIIISGPEDECRSAVSRLELLTDSFLSVGTPVQRTMRELLQIGDEVQQVLQQRIRTNLDYAKNTLHDTAGSVLRTEGGWSAIIRVPQVCSEEVWVTRLLNEQNVLVQPGYFFDMRSEAYVVTSLITIPEIFEQGLERIKVLLTQC